jgi:hypothetical protein
MRQVGIGRGEIDSWQDPVAMAQHILAENAHAAFAREQQTQEDRQRRRLAGAVAAEQGRGRAALDGKADAADGERLAVALDQILDDDDRLGHRLYMAYC